MPYLNIDLNFPEHRKTKRLVSILGRGSEALLLRLWCYIARHHPEDGRLTGYSPEEIESLGGWVGKPRRMIEVMQLVGWLAHDDTGWYAVNWLEHQGHISAFSAKGKAMAEARWEKVRAATRNATSIAGSIPASNARSAPTDPEAGERAGAREAERPSWPEVQLHAQQIGLAVWKARDWFDEMESVGWLDYQHRPVISWRPMLTRVCRKWEADGRPSSPPASRNAPAVNANGKTDLILRQKELERVEQRMRDIRNSYDAHQSWSEKDKTEFKTLKARREQLKGLLGIAV